MNLTKFRNLIEEIEKEARKYFQKARGSHDWSHVERVMKLAVRIGKKERVDLEVVRLAVILHDIGRKKQDEAKGKICHAQESAKLARKILKRHGLVEERVEQVLHCIRSHRFRGKEKPKSLEAEVLFDADNLDAIGAVGLARNYLFAGEIGAKLHNSDVDLRKTKIYSREDTGYREYMVKLRKIKERMLTNEGRRLAKGRHQFMADFYERLEREMRGEQ